MTSQNKISSTIISSTAGRSLEAHSTSASTPCLAQDLAPSAGSLLPIMGVVLIAFLVIGMALPVLPLHVHQGLGLSTVVVGVVTGSQFAAAVLSRIWAGSLADRQGAKRTVQIGLLTAAASGLIYQLSLFALGMPLLSVALLVTGRAALGVAESFVITGAMSWGLAIVGPAHTGRVIARVGLAMFAAMAFGAPVGALLYQYAGFAAIAAATVTLPLLAVAVVAPIAGVSTPTGIRPSILKVARAVWLPGVGAALSSVGFAAILSFGALLFAERGWGQVWLPFSAFAMALVVARVFFGHLPDRIGGPRIALISLFVEATGLTVMWLASDSIVASVGAALTGIGYALVYPGLGIEAVRRAPPEGRGLAMGAYTVFLDVAIGFGSPALGLIAGWQGLGAVFIASAICVLGGTFIAVQLLRATPGDEKRT